MTDPTDKQLEWTARLLCVAENVDPDGPDKDLSRSFQFPDNWEMRLKAARRMLAELERQGVKATPSHGLWLCANDDLVGDQETWEIWHNRAPICPGAE